MGDMIVSKTIQTNRGEFQVNFDPNRYSHNAIKSWIDITEADQGNAGTVETGCYSFKKVLPSDQSV